MLFSVHLKTLQGDATLRGLIHLYTAATTGGEQGNLHFNPGETGLTQIPYNTLQWNKIVLIIKNKQKNASSPKLHLWAWLSLAVAHMYMLNAFLSTTLWSDETKTDTKGIFKRTKDFLNVLSSRRLETGTEDDVTSGGWHQTYMKAAVGINTAS